MHSCCVILTFFCPCTRLMMEFRVMHRDVRPPPEGHADRVMGCLQLPFEALTAAPSGTHSYARDAFVLGPERDTSMDPYLVRGGMGRGGNMGGANYSASACHSVQDCLDAYPDEVQVCIRHGLCWSDQQGHPHISNSTPPCDANEPRLFRFSC